MIGAKFESAVNQLLGEHRVRVRKCISGVHRLQAMAEMLNLRDCSAVNTLHSFKQ